MLFVDPAGPKARELMAEGFRLSDPLERAALDVSDQLIDAPQHAAVGLLPEKIVFPSPDPKM